MAASQQITALRLVFVITALLITAFQCRRHDRGSGTGVGHAMQLDFAAEPVTQLVKFDGERATMKCAGNIKAAEVVWLFNNRPLNENSFNGLIKKNRNKLIIRLPALIDANGVPLSPETPDRAAIIEKTIDALDGVIQCLLTFNDESMISKPAKILVAKLSPFPKGISNTTVAVYEENVAVIVCEPPDSVPPAVTEFRFNGNIIDKSTDKYHIMPSGNLQIFNVQPSDSGVYECIAHNPFLRVREAAGHSVTLKVKSKRSGGRNGKNAQIRFSVIPKPFVNPVLGSNLTLECATTAASPPQITWSRMGAEMPARNKYTQVGGNLILQEVTSEEEGTYVCQAADLHSGSQMEVKSLVSVYELPVAKITQSMVPEGTAIDCETKGNPLPHLTWVFNGRLLEVQESDPAIAVTGPEKKRVIVRRDGLTGGIFQCFASNELGTTFDVARVGVEPVIIRDQIPKDITPTGSEEQPPKDSSRNRPSTNTSSGIAMNVPTRPEVYRLSDDSVMVKWQVHSSPEGMGIQFFKVQYKEVIPKGTEPRGNEKRSEWKTVDEEIAPQIRSHPVSGLRTGAKYKFRVAAVYTNNDNKMGPHSGIFHLLKNPPAKKPKQGPTIVSATAASPTAITVNWYFTPPEDVLIEGFYIHFRDASSAGQYFIETIHGANVRSHIVSHLLPGTSYDLKMQAFSAAGPSDFSNIVSNRTMPDPNVVTSSTEGPKVLVPVSKSPHNDHIVYIVGGTVLVVFLVFVVLVVFCVTRLKQSHQSASSHVDLVANKNLKNAKERHPKAHSLHNLNHPSHFSKLDYGNPYGNYAKSNGLNGNLAKSVNGLAVKSSISSGFVFRDVSEPERNEIRIRVNPLTDDITVGFESGRNRTLSSTTFTSRSHSSRDLLSRNSTIPHHHNLNHNVNSAIPAGDVTDNNNTISNESNNYVTTVSGSNTTERRRKIGDEVHPNYYGVKINHRSSSFTRLNGTLERKRRTPMRSDLLCFEQTSTTKVNNDTVVSTRCSGETTTTTTSSAGGQLVIMQSSC